MQGSIQAQRAQEMPNLKIKFFQQISEMIQALKAGQTEATRVAEPVATRHLAANPDLEAHQMPNIPGKSGSAIVFPKGSPLLPEFELPEFD